MQRSINPEASRGSSFSIRVDLCIFFFAPTAFVSYFISIMLRVCAKRESGSKSMIHVEFLIPAYSSMCLLPVRLIGFLNSLPTVLSRYVWEEIFYFLVLCVGPLVLCVPQERHFCITKKEANRKDIKYYRYYH